MRSKLLFIMILLFTVNLFSWSSFRKNVPQTLVQPSGDTIHVFASGDEFHNWIHNEKGQTIVQDPVSGYYVYATLEGDELVPSSMVVKDKEVATGTIQPNLNIPVKTYQQKYQALRSRQIPVRKRDESSLRNASTVNQGKCTNLVVLVGFSDVVKMSYTYEQIDSLYNHPVVWSVRTNYLADSYGKMTVESPVFPQSGSVYIDSHPRNYYSPYNVVTNPNGYKDGNESYKRETQLITAALEKAKQEIDPNLNLDQDGDGYVDNVTILFASDPDGWSSLLWGHATFFSHESDLLINGKKVGRYNFLPLDNEVGPTSAHEIGHSFGYPDLYHYTQDGFVPVGKWDMQAANVGHHGAYMKYLYGNWVGDLPLLTKPGTYTLNPLNSATDQQVGYRIPSPNSSDEFFVVEYRKPDPHIENQFEEDGLLLYRINSTSTGNVDGGWGDFRDEVYVFRPGGSLVANGDLDRAQQPASGISDISRNRLFLSDGKDGSIILSDIKKENGQLSFGLDFTATPFLDVSQETEIIPSAGGKIVWPVMSNATGWKVTTAEEWVTASVDAESEEIRLDIENNSGDPRLATILVEAEGVSTQKYYLAQKSPDPNTALLFLVDEEPVISIGNYPGAKRVLHVIGENYGAMVLDGSGRTHSSIFTAVDVKKNCFLFVRDAVESDTPVKGELVLAAYGYNQIMIKRPVEVVSSTLSLSRNIVQFMPKDERTQSIEVESTSAYQLENTIPGWLTVQQSADKKSLAFKVNDNTSPGTRMAQLSVKSGMISKPVVISQKASIPDLYFTKCPPIESGKGKTTVWEYKTNADNIRFEYTWDNSDLSFVHDAANHTLAFTPNKPGNVGVSIRTTLDDFSFEKYVNSTDYLDFYKESTIYRLPPEKKNTSFMTVSDRFLTDFPNLRMQGLTIERVDEPDVNVYSLTTMETNYSLFDRDFGYPINLTQVPAISIDELAGWDVPFDPSCKLPVDFTFQNFYMIDKITCDQSWVEWDMKQTGFSIRRTGYAGELPQSAIVTLHSGTHTYPVQYIEVGYSTDPYLYIPLSEANVPASFWEIVVPVRTSTFGDIACTLSGETKGISVVVEPDTYEGNWRFMGSVRIKHDIQVSEGQERTFTLQMQIGNQRKDFTVHTKKEALAEYDPEDPGVSNEEIQVDAQSSVKIYLVGGVVHVDSPYPVADITVYGTSGQTLIRQDKGGDRVDVSALSAGIYFVKVRTDQGTTVQKIVKPLSL